MKHPVDLSKIRPMYHCFTKKAECNVELRACCRKRLIADHSGTRAYRAHAPCRAGCGWSIPYERKARW